MPVVIHILRMPFKFFDGTTILRRLFSFRELSSNKVALTARCDFREMIPTRVTDTTQIRVFKGGRLSNRGCYREVT